MDRSRQFGVYGLAQCWSRISLSLCRDCIYLASQKLWECCPKNEEAIIWYDHCLLKYLFEIFLGISDTDNGEYVEGKAFVEVPFLFDKKVQELLTRLCAKAYVTPQFYAHGT